MKRNKGRRTNMGKDRGKDRYTYAGPDSVYVRFKIDKGPEEGREHVLNVIDSSKTGLALLVTDKNSDLLRILDKGDPIRKMTFFGARVRIKEDGIVRHITKVKDGEYRGCYILGVYAPDIAE
jgi:hypothetical protein